MSRLQTVAQIATAISALVAVVTLVIAFRDAASRSHEAQLREWQKVVVFSIVEREGPPGASFEKIRSRYREEAQAYVRFDVPKEEIGEQALQRVLVGLMADHAIMPGPGRTYQVAFAPPSGELMLRRAERLSAAGDTILALLRTEGCRYTIDQLRAKVLDRVKLESGELEGTIASLRAYGMIGFTPQGLVCSPIAAGSPRQ